MEHGKADHFFWPPSIMEIIILDLIMGFKFVMVARWYPALLHVIQ